MTFEPTSIRPTFTRRRFLAGAGALAGGAALASYLPASVRQAIASTSPAPFDLSQVKHIVLMMQENRSFDHYFGSLSGVRGFSDPDALILPNGLSVFHQPDPANPEGYLLPFHVDNQTLASLDHSLSAQHECWNHGQMDGFVRTHGTVEGLADGPYTMAYLDQDDLPFHYALANAFTVCDGYHCSIMGPTYPNRLMWMTGSIDVNGANGGPITSNTNLPGASLSWTTPAEVLQQHGVSWKVYQPLSSATAAQPTTPAQMQTALNVENHNMFLSFPNIWGADQTVPFGIYQNAALGSTLFGSPNGNGLAGHNGVINPYNGKPCDFTTSFEEDCVNGTLPTVSWIVGPENTTEHPAYRPIDGANYIASKIAALSSNPDLWNSTVFILNYDENDGLFDHVAPIVPPAGTPNEFLAPGTPIGSGFRVPCIVISPWTVGGYVASEALDHTSCLRFIEAVCFGGEATFPSLSEWRRETFGNFTGVFQTGPGAPTAPTDPANPSDPNFTYASITAKQASLPGGTNPSLPRNNQVVPTQTAGTRPSPN